MIELRDDALDVVFGGLQAVLCGSGTPDDPYEVAGAKWVWEIGYGWISILLEMFPAMSSGMSMAGLMRLHTKRKNTKERSGAP